MLSNVSEGTQSKGVIALVVVAVALFVIALVVSLWGQRKGFQPGWHTDIDNVLLAGVTAHTFPGAVAIVGTSDGVVYHKAVGAQTYTSKTSLTTSALFDIASLTKVIATTSAVMYLHQRGHLNLKSKVADILGAQFATNGKEAITIENLLLHNAGLLADPIPEFWTKEFGCPNSADASPAQDFTCQPQIFASLMNETVVYPIGSRTVYSDTGMMILMYVVGQIARNRNYIKPSDSTLRAGCPSIGQGSQQCYFDAFVRKYILATAKMTDTDFVPADTLSSRCVPTWNETGIYRNELIQGVVSDRNAYAMGGVSGHAGLFSTAADLAKLVDRLLFAPVNSTDFISAATVEIFTRRAGSNSSRALGWDTTDNSASSTSTSSMCGSLSTNTFMHSGFTGTLICADKDRKVYSILLANRVYTQEGAKGAEMTAVRTEFNTIIAKAMPILPKVNATLTA